MHTQGTLEQILQRDRLYILTGMVLLAALAWGYLGYMMMEMSMMEAGTSMTMPRMNAWGMVDLILLFAMWVIMMVAMMLPSATPMILIFARLNRQRLLQKRPYVPTFLFLAGYLIVWTGYSLLATLLQWQLHETALLSPMMVSTSPLLAGPILVGAGIFQFTRLKRSCLRHCRSPLSFLTSSWREGRFGALRMGIAHGSYCVGCCWILMALLFVAGVMNLAWIAVITIFVLAEKAFPAGEFIGKAAGLLLVAGGVLQLIR